MHFSYVLSVCLASVLTTASAQPSTQTLGARSLDTRDASSPSTRSASDQFVVLLNASHPSNPQVEDILACLSLTTNHSDVIHTYNNSAFTGFAAYLGLSHTSMLNNMSEVAVVEAAVQVQSRAPISQPLYSRQALSTRVASPWGLQRVSSTSPISGNPSSMAYTYAFQDSSLGAGVDIYIVDTGINVQHEAFQGRATMGYSFNTSDYTDGDGHGTHVSGTAAGNPFGVASNANLIGVKVLGSDGSGSSANVIAGMDWAINAHNTRKSAVGFVGSVMSMSWGLGNTSPAVEQAITAAVQAGIHTTVAAGNDGANACSYSPSSSGGSSGPAISVGSIGTGNAISSFSNTGSCVDIYAPGENVLSAWIGSDNVVNFLSGTSMATPHVSGVLAYLMTTNSTLAASPSALKTYVLDMAITGAVTGTANSGDTKLMLNNGVTGGGMSDGSGSFRS